TLIDRLRVASARVGAGGTGGGLPRGGRLPLRHHRTQWAHAIGQPDVEYRMLDGVEAWAIREHPPRKDAFFLIIEEDLVDLDEGGGLGRLGGGARVARTRRDLEGTELCGLIE